MAAKKTEILVVCKDPDILATILRLLEQQAEWNAKGVATESEARAAFDRSEIDIALLGSGFDKATEEALTKYFKNKKPSVKVVQHYGGGSGLLFNEIMMALSKKE